MTSGERAPAFTAFTPNGQPVTLDGLNARRVLLFFYPKDSSLGCSMEARAFQQRLSDFDALGVTVVGASTGNPASQASFREKCDLSFPLVSDPDRSVAKSYGVLGGLTGLLGLTSRTSFLIGKDGRVEKVYGGVNPSNHAQQVLDELKKLPA